MNSSQNKLGAPPGTLVYYGEDHTDKVKITLKESSSKKIFMIFRNV
jgi:hypothetical protein